MDNGISRRKLITKWQQIDNLNSETDNKPAVKPTTNRKQTDNKRKTGNKLMSESTTWCLGLEKTYSLLAGMVGGYYRVILPCFLYF